jgi:arylsulfatase A-like enzyme
MSQKSKNANDIFLLAAGFGLLTGIVEGLGLLLLHQTQFLNWRLYNRAIWYETLWIAPLIDLVLFSLAGGFFALVGSLVPKLPTRKIAWFAFVLFAIFDWIFFILYGRISLVAILILTVGISYQAFNILVKRIDWITQKLQTAVIWLAGLSLALFVTIQGGGWLRERILTSALPVSRTDAPNVIVLIVDTLRADHLSSYGYERETSPFMDGLASEGVLFEHAIAPSSWTQPSHASLLTGYYTYDHQAELKPMDDRFATIGESLQARGYRTGAFSANTEFFTRRQGFGRGFLHFEDNYLSVPDAFFNSSVYGFIFDFYGLRKTLKYEGVPTRRYADDINHAALRWIDQDSNKPFFVFINYFDVHDPYIPPDPYRNRFASTPNPGGLVNGFMERYSPSLTPEQIQTEIDGYDGAISYVDDEIKRLFAELETRGLLENSVVIITSDHGEAFGEHGFLQHSASLYLPELHVPLIIWGPEYVPAGRSIDTPVTIAAIPATILALIDPPDKTFPGPSLTLLMSEEGEIANWPDPIAELAHFPGAAEINPSTHGAMKSVVDTDMQYIVHQAYGEELYNWRDDPDETNNLVDSPSSETILESFRSYLKGLIGDLFNSP